MITTVISFVLVLGFLIFIHELGHYLAARHVGVRVETFSIGFPPRMKGFKYGDTEYQICWIPLGGYVRLFGQNVSDEDAEDPRNYAAKSVWQRFYILVAGPAMNLLFAFLFMPLVYLVGVDAPSYLSAPPIVHEIKTESFAASVGLQPGDEVVAINGKSVSDWRTLQAEWGNLTPADSLQLTVARNGREVEVLGSMREVQQYGEMGWVPRIPAVIGKLSSDSVAAAAGVQVGDRLVSISGETVNDWSDISRIVQELQPAPPAAATPLTLALQRDGQRVLVEVAPQYNAEVNRYLLGLQVGSTRENYGFSESVSMGAERVVFLTQTTFSFLGQMLSGQGSTDDLGGPVRIGMFIGDAVRSGAGELFFLVAVISLQLGIFNLLPIPALDGGHIFFLMVEKLKGGPLSAEMRERTQMIGFSALLLLMVFVTYHDIVSIAS
jgi:regulator of sigma E protease